MYSTVKKRYLDHIIKDLIPYNRVRKSDKEEMERQLTLQQRIIQGLGSGLGGKWGDWACRLYFFPSKDMS